MMTDTQKQKIMDAMHTLSVIREGLAACPRVSADACWHVLDWVMQAEDINEPPQSIANRYYAMGVNHTGPKVPMPCAPPYRNLNE